MSVAVEYINAEKIKNPIHEAALNTTVGFATFMCCSPRESWMRCPMLWARYGVLEPCETLRLDDLSRSCRDMTTLVKSYYSITRRAVSFLVGEHRLTQYRRLWLADRNVRPTTAEGWHPQTCFGGELDELI